MSALGTAGREDGVGGRRRPVPHAPATAVRFAFVMGAATSLLPVVSAGAALGMGAVFGLVLGNPYPSWARVTSGRLLKTSVVGLGFGMSGTAVVTIGLDGLWIITGAMVATMFLGLALGRWLHVPRHTSALITGGTAICGGSAIAALGPVLGASAGAMSVSLATVFVLNGVALYAFPAVGHLAGLSQAQFATWAAIAIHDTSSVLGAADAYGSEALRQATVLKLVRALWIVPLVVAVSAVRRRGTRAKIRPATPVFIGLFVVAVAVRTVWPAPDDLYRLIVLGARRGLVLALFLVGSGLDTATLGAVGFRPALHGTVLWLLVAAGSLAAVIRWTS